MGIVATYSDKKCIDSIVLGIFSLQHLGEEYCGIVTYNGKKIRISKQKGKVLDSFTKAKLKKLRGNQGVGYTGLLEQPLTLDSNLGPFTTAFDGKILNRNYLIKKLKKRGHTFSLYHKDIEVIAQLMAESSNFIEGIKNIANKVKGPFSAVFLNKEGIYAVRGPYGLEPFIVGMQDGVYAVASESCALKELSFKKENYKDIEPGEIIFLNSKGVKSVGKLENKAKALCAFRHGYFSRIDSVIEGIPVKVMRERAGAAQARREQKGFKPDLAMPIRDSGVGYTIGYVHELKVPYDEGLFKNWYITRTYMQLKQLERERGASFKQSVIESAVKDKEIVVIDDSIRRATTIQKLIYLLRWAGAKTVHVRIGSPENKYACKYSIPPSKKKEFISATKTPEEIAKFIGADSLRFNSIDDYVEAIGLPRQELCLGCWTGVYPI